MTKEIAGYNILMLLSMVDGEPHKKEDAIIKKWLENEFQFTKNLDEELAFLTVLPLTDYEAFMHSNMDTYHTLTTQNEQHKLLQFAVAIIKADGKIVPEENKLFDYLYTNWHTED